MINFIYTSTIYIISITPYILFGYGLNKFYSMYQDYKTEKNPKKVVIKQIYYSLFDVLYKQFGENINELNQVLKQVSDNKLSLEDFDKLKKIAYLTIDISKYNNIKYKLVINNNILTVKLLDKEYIHDRNLNSLLSLLDIKVKSKLDDDNLILFLEQKESK
jgi:hypothetical protein